MNIKFLLLGTSLSFIPTLSFAQCVETTNCEKLGYTETSCNGDKGVKCPFGNKWFCFETEEEFKTRLCPELGFTLDCSGENQTGSNYNCNGKYNYCNCAEGYGWKNGKCIQIEKTETINGAQGELFYCNGAVVAVKTSDMDFYIALNELGPIVWKEADNSCQTYSFCGNLKGSLPSIEQMLKIYKQKDLINNLLTEYKGKLMEERYYFSISPYGETTQNVVDMSNGETGPFLGVVRGYVRPVLTSW